MKKSTSAANPDTYVAALEGWQRPCVEKLRATVRASAKLDDVVTWGRLVCDRGPASCCGCTGQAAPSCWAPAFVSRWSGGNKFGTTS